MFSRKRLALLAAVVASLAGVDIYVAASNAARAPLEDSRGNVTIRPWGEDLSEGAVDSNGIERDLDGNASALIPSDRLP